MAYLKGIYCAFRLCAVHYLKHHCSKGTLHKVVVSDRIFSLFRTAWMTKVWSLSSPLFFRSWDNATLRVRFPCSQAAALTLFQSLGSSPLKLHVFWLKVNLWIYRSSCGSVGTSLPANAGEASVILGLGRSPEGGKGNPLQYCLENPMDREVWQTAVHRVTKSQTQLSD